jgi:hypothetical protein
LLADLRIFIVDSHRPYNLRNIATDNETVSRVHARLAYHSLHRLCMMVSCMFSLIIHIWDACDVVIYSLARMLVALVR